MTRDERRFILSVKEAHPLWDLLGIDEVQNYPAIKWKLLNISKMVPSKHKEAVRKLTEYLNI